MAVFMLLAMLRILVFRPEDTASLERREIATVRVVIDGDTIDLTDGRRVRLLGIDAPEAGFSGSIPEFFAAESTEWLRRRIEGQDIRLRIDSPEPDRYGRVLAWIFAADGVLINQQMLAEGQARLLADYGLPLDLESGLRQAESEARVQKLGLWNGARRSRR